MRVVLDTNILVSSLIRPASVAHQIYEWVRTGRIELVTCDIQMEEFRRVTRYPKVRRYITPAEAGSMLNELRELATYIEISAKEDISRDPADNFLFAMVQAAGADYLVTGDKADVLAIGRHGKTRVVTARQLMEILKP